MKADPKIDSKNIFAIGFSNGGFWASFLAGKGIVTAAASHYGVWRACKGRCENFYPVKYFSSNSSPFLALHGADDSTQKIKYFYDAWDRIKGTPGIEKYVFGIASHLTQS
jgi:poly(3-hydroxybutyrate) depolymerase